MSDRAPVLDVGDLVVRYGRKEALAGVDIRYDGGSLGLLGPNGAGKSSLLRAVLGLIVPARGRVSVLGIDARAHGIQVRANAGYMPESDCHVPGLTGLEFTAYCARLAGLSAPDAKRRAHEVLVYVGLDEERYRKVDEYSRGMKQKVKFAAALVHDPSVLFLDEPTNGLDPQARQELLTLIRDLGSKGMNIVLSSHLLRDVEAVCDDMIVLAQGAVCASGGIEALKGLKGGFVVQVAGIPAAFEEAARERGLEVTRDTRGAFSVRAAADGELTGRDLFALGRAAGTPIRHLAPQEESLEDLFLRAITPADGGA